MICCLVFSALIGCGAQKEELKMKTFENKNLSVDYPEGWSAGDYESYDKREVVAIKFEPLENPGKGILVDISISNNHDIADFPISSRDVREDEKIGGIDFVSYTQKIKQTIEIKLCSAKKKGKTIVIALWYPEKEKITVEKILGTLKFKF
jgi:hypothetical protein